jgi:hypothetical protein
VQEIWGISLVFREMWDTTNLNFDRLLGPKLSVCNLRGLAVKRTLPTFAKSGHPLTTNCIDCHMPQVRSHWIKVNTASDPISNRDTPKIP